MRGTILILTLVLAEPAYAACVDWPVLNSQGLSVRMFVRTHGASSCWGRGLLGEQVGLVKLDCDLGLEEWSWISLPFPRRICSGTAVAKPGGGDCRVVELKPLSGPTPDPKNYETVTGVGVVRGRDDERGAQH
jgi:hypothetical protein